MFDLHVNEKGEKVLKYIKRYRRPFERGLWIEIGHEKDKDVTRAIEVNRQAGLQVEKDDKGFYRALVLSE